MSETHDRWEFYKDARDKWRWRRIASNGKIVAASTEGYAKRASCMENAKRCGFEGSESASGA